MTPFRVFRSISDLADNCSHYDNIFFNSSLIPTTVVSFLVFVNTTHECFSTISGPPSAITSFFKKSIIFDPLKRLKLFREMQITIILGIGKPKMC